MADEENNVKKLLRGLLSGAQTVETALGDLYDLRSVDTAEGDQLDVIGRIVGQDREGLADDIYRRYIRARISANRSTGEIADQILVASQVVDDDAATYVVDNQGTAAYVLRVEGVAVAADVADVLIDMLRQSTSAGVRVILEYSTLVPTAPWFQWDTAGAGWDQGFFLDAVD